jgi:putative transposase
VIPVNTPKRSRSAGIPVHDKPESVFTIRRNYRSRSTGIPSYRKVTSELRELGEACGKHRIARLMRMEGLRSRKGYGRRSGGQAGKPSDVSPSLLQRQFDVVQPNKAWVTDITYLRAHEGWLFLAVVMDLFSRQIIGCSMSERMTSDLALNALLMAVWPRKPNGEVMVHSGHGSQGGFNRSSQHLQLGGIYGATSRMDEATDRERHDALSRSSFASAKDLPNPEGGMPGRL